MTKMLCTLSLNDTGMSHVYSISSYCSIGAVGIECLIIKQLKIYNTYGIGVFKI